MQTQLTCSTTDKVIGGVCGGIAESFGLDPVLVRLGFVALTVFSGFGLGIYLVLMLVLPKVGEQPLMRQALAGAEQRIHSLHSNDHNRTFGYILLAIGGIMLINMLHLPGPVFALMLVGAGWYLLRGRR